MRKPYYWKRLKAWYVKSKDGSKNIRLHEDEEQAHDIWAEMRDAEDPAAPNVVVDVIADEFLSWGKKHRPRTVDWYAVYIVKFCSMYGENRVRDLRPFHVDRWVETNGWQDQSARAAIGTVKTMLNWAKKKGYVKENPLANVEKPGAKRREILISDEDHQKMMTAEDENLSKSRRHAPFRLVLIALRHSGARPGTIAAVTARNVSPDFDRWIMPEHKTRRKTKKPLTIYLSPCLQTLTRILAERRKDGPLFLNCENQPWTRNAIRCRMRRLREKLNLPTGTVAYAYRHTFATKAIIGGTDIATVAELLGHSDIRMVQNHYGHLDQAADHLRRAVASVYSRKNAEPKAQPKKGDGGAS